MAVCLTSPLASRAANLHGRPYNRWLLGCWGNQTAWGYFNFPETVDYWAIGSSRVLGYLAHAWSAWLTCLLGRHHVRPDLHIPRSTRWTNVVFASARQSTNTVRADGGLSCMFYGAGGHQLCDLRAQQRKSHASWVQPHASWVSQVMGCHRSSTSSARRLCRIFWLVAVAGSSHLVP